MPAVIWTGHSFLKYQIGTVSADTEKRVTLIKTAQQKWIGLPLTKGVHGAALQQGKLIWF